MSEITLPAQQWDTYRTILNALLSSYAFPVRKVDYAVQKTRDRIDQTLSTYESQLERNERRHARKDDEGNLLYRDQKTGQEMWRVENDGPRQQVEFKVEADDGRVPLREFEVEGEDGMESYIDVHGHPIQRGDQELIFEDEEAYEEGRRQAAESLETVEPYTVDEGYWTKPDAVDLDAVQQAHQELQRMGMRMKRRPHEHAEMLVLEENHETLQEQADVDLSEGEENEEGEESAAETEEAGGSPASEQDESQNETHDPDEPTPEE